MQNQFKIFGKLKNVLEQLKESEEQNADKL